MAIKLSDAQKLALSYYAQKRLGFRRRPRTAREVGARQCTIDKLIDAGLIEHIGWNYGPLYRATIEGVRVWASSND